MRDLLFNSAVKTLLEPCKAFGLVTASLAASAFPVIKLRLPRHLRLQNFLSLSINILKEDPSAHRSAANIFLRDQTSITRPSNNLFCVPYMYHLTILTIIVNCLHLLYSYHIIRIAAAKHGSRTTNKE
jgi:hypothetical protein